MRIKKLHVRDLFSLKDVSIDFGESGLVLLDGWNYDTGSANGAGKSSCFNAITFALWDKVPKKINKTDILRHSCKSGYAMVELEASGKTIRVVRRRPSKLEVHIDGKVSNVTQDELNRMLGISYEQYVLCAYLAQGSPNKFLYMNDSDKKDFLVKLINMERIYDLKSCIDASIKKFESARSKLLVERASLASKIAVYKEQLVDQDEIRRQIEKNNVSKLVEERAEIERRIGSCSTEPLKELLDKLYVKQQEAVKTLKTRDAYLDAISALRKQKQSLDIPRITCSNCNEELLVRDGSAVSYRSYVEKITRYNEDIDRRISKINEDLSNLDVADVDRIRQAIEKISADIRSQQKLVRDDEERLRSIDRDIAAREALIKQLNEKLEQVSHVRQKIDRLSSELEALDDKLTKLNSIAALHQAALDVVRPTGLPAYILDSVIATFNERVDEYMANVWPGMRYELRSYKTTRSGDVKAVISDYVLVDGIERKLGSLSGGEARCLSLIVDIALLETLLSMLGVNVTPILMDEPFEGLDSVNRERVIHAISRLASSREVWIIDHMGEAKSMFDRTVRVEKRAGVSRVVI